ncbi:hypothetical protein [Streptomyces sp. MK7]|uniref:hypothetical protein n=1 Tax=Streptomyces sp. MK7 TaxID=3067635 RepID=UPI002931C9C6|nr:hypothetical protein [Streptomyces sp. MK7]
MLVGAVFFIGGLIFVFNPLGIAEKYIRFTSRMGGPRFTVSERYLSRRVGTAFVPIGGGILGARLLLALAVKESALMSSLPVAVASMLVIVGTTLYLVYRASSRHDGS